MAEKKNPQNARILEKYKNYLTDEEKYFLENDALVAPRYRTSKPVGRNDRGEPYFDVSYAPEFKENSMVRSTTSPDAGAGRGFVNPRRTDEYKKGGKVSSASKRADGIAKRGKTRGKIV